MQGGALILGRRLPATVRVPTATRVLSAILGGIVALLQLGPGLRDLTSDPIVATTRLLVGIPFVLVFVWVAAWPEHAGSTLRERFDVDLRDTGTVAGVLVHVVFVYLVFGGTLLATGRGLSELIATGEHPVAATELTGQSVVTNLVLNLVLFLVATLTWLMLVDGDQGSEILEALRLEPDRLPRGLVAGVLMTAAVLVGMAGLGYGLQQIGYTPRNPQADAIAEALTPATAVLVAVLAGLGEEIYFRGFLLPRTGNLAQATLFGLLHATYLTPFQVILPFVLGLAFGWLTRRSGLWGAIVAHTSFNAIMLLTSIYAGDLPDGQALAALLG